MHFHACTKNLKEFQYFIDFIQEFQEERGGEE